MAVAMAVTRFLNNAVTVLIMAPIAAMFANRLGLAPDAFLMAVAVSWLRLPDAHRSPVQHTGHGAQRLPLWRLRPPCCSPFGARRAGRRSLDLAQLANLIWPTGFFVSRGTSLRFLSHQPGCICPFLHPRWRSLSINWPPLTPQDGMVGGHPPRSSRGEDTDLRRYRTAWLFDHCSMRSHRRRQSGFNVAPASHMVQRQQAIMAQPVIIPA